MDIPPGEIILRWKYVLPSVTLPIPLRVAPTFIEKKVREKSRECHNHKSQPFQDTKRKSKLTNQNKRKSNKRTKSTKISYLFPNAKGQENTKKNKIRKTILKTNRLVE